MDLLNSKINKYSKKITSSNNQDKKNLYSTKLNNYMQARHELQKYIEKGGNIADFPAIITSSNSLSDKSKEILSRLQGQTIEGYNKESVDKLFADLKQKMVDFDTSKTEKSKEVSELISNLYKNIFGIHKEISQLDGFKHNVGNFEGEFGNLNFDILSLIKEQVSNSIQEHFINELKNIDVQLDDNGELSEVTKKNLNIYIEQINNLDQNKDFKFDGINEKIVKYISDKLEISEPLKTKDQPNEEKPGSNPDSIPPEETSDIPIAPPMTNDIPVAPPMTQPNGPTAPSMTPSVFVKNNKPNNNTNNLTDTNSDKTISQDFLDEIRKGKKLNNVLNRKLKEKPSSTNSILSDALKNKFKQANGDPQDGGFYYNKYLEYKQKYLQLKNSK